MTELPHTGVVEWQWREENPGRESTTPLPTNTVPVPGDVGQKFLDLPRLIKECTAKGILSAMFTLKFAFGITTLVATLLALSRYHLGIGLFGLSLTPLLSYLFRSSKKTPRTRFGRIFLLSCCVVPVYVGSIGPLLAILYVCYAYQVRPPWVDELPTRIYTPLTWLPEDSPPGQLLSQYVLSWENGAYTLVHKYRAPPDGWSKWGPPAD